MILNPWKHIRELEATIRRKDIYLQQAKEIIEAYEQTTINEIGQGCYIISMPDSPTEQLKTFAERWDKWKKDKPLLHDTLIVTTNKSTNIKTYTREELTRLLEAIKPSLTVQDRGTHETQTD